MGRLSTTLAAAVAGASVHTAIFVRLAFPSSTLYLTDAPFPVSYGGHTYTNDGTLRNISSIQERTDSKVGSVTVDLSAANSTVRSAFVSSAYQFCEAEVAWGFLSSGTLLDSESLGTFLMSTGEYDIGAGSIGLVCEPVAIRLKRANMVMASNADQDKRYSGDTFFTHCAALDEKEIEWGGMRAVLHMNGGTPIAGGYGGTFGLYGSGAVNGTTAVYDSVAVGASGGQVTA